MYVSRSTFKSSGEVFNKCGSKYAVSMAGYDGGIREGIKMPITTVEPYADNVKVVNYVYENGYRQAVLRGESTYDGYYSVRGMWTADSQS